MEQGSEQLYGWGSLRPRCLQVFNTPYWALFFLSVASFLQGFVVNGLVNTVVTSIERRFDLSSSQSGFVISSFDIASCVCLPFISYFGGKGHKSQWLGWCMGSLALGSLLFALPHFTAPAYQATVLEGSDLCLSNTTDPFQDQASPQASPQAPGVSMYFYVLVLGQLLHGIGATPLFTLGYTFLDEIVLPNNVPVFLGVFYTASTVGPAVGMFLGGFLLRFYSEMTETDLTPASPLWVGAWWIGFLLSGTLSFPVAFAILGFPKKLLGTQESPDSCGVHPDKGGHLPPSASHPGFGETVRDMLRSVLLLLRIPIFVFLCLMIAGTNGQIAVTSGFIIKFFESQFGLSSSQSSLIFGATVIPFAAGTMTGSFFVKRFRLKTRGILGFCIVSTAVGLLFNAMFFIHCPTASFAGATVPYAAGPPPLQGESGAPSQALWSPCNGNCSCQRRFSPVCGADRVTYFSPCFAGCTSADFTDAGQMFANCSCVGANTSTVVPGKCASSCSHLPLFLGLNIMSSFITGLSMMPPITLTLRCVPEKQKSFALGIQWIIVRTLGSIPAPIIFGSVLDQACVLQQSEDQGSCFLYENSQMSLCNLITGFIYRGFQVICLVLALVFFKAPSADPLIPESPSIRDLHDKTPPEGGVTALQHTRL